LLKMTTGVVFQLIQPDLKCLKCQMINFFISKSKFFD